MKTSYRTEFPDFDPATLPAIPDGFEDISWHNDACPSFQDYAFSLRLFVNYADPADREVPFKRFVLDRYNPETDIEGEFLLETDDWNEVLKVINDHRPPALAQK